MPWASANRRSDPPWNHGSVATFDWRSIGSEELGRETVDAASSGGQFEELVDELNLTPNISSAHPPNLPLPQHVHRLITLNGSLRRLEFSEPLLGVHAAFDRAVILLEDIVQVLIGAGNGGEVSLPSLCRGWPSRRSVPDPY